MKILYNDYMINTMKHTFRYIISALALLIPVLAQAQTLQDPPIYSNYKIEGGVAMGKTVTAINSTTYKLTLETFVTGKTTIVDETKPVDLILVLDVSSSMTMYDYTYKLEDGTSTTGTRLEALQYAVKRFIKEIAHNDAYREDGTRRKNAAGDEIVLGNRIQMITFSTANATRASFTTFQPAFANESSILNAVDNFSTDNGTHPDAGISLANTWLSTSVSEKPNSNRVVVVFTDGLPGDTWPPSFDVTIGRDAVNNARTSKITHGATVFTIGLIDYSGMSSTEESRVRNMLSYISSNYPDGSASTRGRNITFSGNRGEGDFAFDANEKDLGDIFEDVAHASGGSEASVPGESQVVDEVSSSFKIPANYTANNVVVYYRTINLAGDTWEGSVETTMLNKVILPENFDLNALPPSDATYMTDDDKVGVYLHNGKLVILGFDYSRKDSEGADGTDSKPYDGWWVGWRDVNKCFGRELVIELNIEPINGVTGGDNTNTNTASSGIYIPQYDASGNFTGYAPISKYPYPDTDLPINIVIQKDGLKHGESATIQIYRSPQMTTGDDRWDPVTGKPKPIAQSDDDWENFTKVILTNKGEDNETVFKTLLSLDPTYVYKLVEDDWGFGYKLDTKTITTSQQVKNPFIFTNQLKVTKEDWGGKNPLKHAEAVSINHFGTNAHKDNYKSSKTQF